MSKLSSVYHGEHGLRMLKEWSRSYLTISKDLGRVMNRLKALYRGWAIPCAGTQVYAPHYRSTKLRRLSKTTLESRVHVQTVGLNAETKKCRHRADGEEGAPQESDESRGPTFRSAFPEVLKATTKLGTT
jgi:hypothetical protein